MATTFNSQAAADQARNATATYSTIGLLALDTVIPEAREWARRGRPMTLEGCFRSINSDF